MFESIRQKPEELALLEIGLKTSRLKLTPNPTLGKGFFKEDAFKMFMALHKYDIAFIFTT